ncbi:auxin response factor 8-like protein isoform X2, partial [Tanacetum coccineum]
YSIRATRPQTVMLSSVLSSDSMHIGLLAAAATNSCFTIFYNPRASPCEFVIPLSKYVKVVYHIRVSIGMHFRMLFETEESSVRRYMGTKTGIAHESHSEAVKKAISGHHAAVSGGVLLKLPFTSIFEYLQPDHIVDAEIARNIRILYTLRYSLAAFLSQDDSLVFHVFILNDELHEVPYILGEITDFDSCRLVLWSHGGDTSDAVSFIHENLNQLDTYISMMGCTSNCYSCFLFLIYVTCGIL